LSVSEAKVNTGFQWKCYLYCKFTYINQNWFSTTCN